MRPPLPFESSAVSLRQKIPGGRWYDEAVPHFAAGSGEFTGTVSFGSTLLTAIYRDRVKWVCSADGLFTGSVSFEFLMEKAKKCAALY